MHLYYRVSPTSPAMKIVDRMKAEHAAAAKGIRAFLKSQGLPRTTKTWGTESVVYGLSGRVDLPGWRYDSKEGFTKPALKTPEGRAIAQQLKAIPKCSDTRSLSDELFNHGMVMGTEGRGLGFCLRSAVFGWNKHGVVIAMHAAVKKAAKKWPKGLKEITGTEAAKFNGSGEE